MENNRNTLSEEEFVKHLVPDPSQPPDVKLLSGFMGKSSRPKHWRIYLTPELTSFIDIPEEDIVYSQPIKNEQTTLGGTFVWVRRDADLKSTSMTSRETQADFLRGTIMASMTRRVAAGQLPRLPVQTTLHPVLCSPPTENNGESCLTGLCTLTTCYSQTPTDPGCGVVRGF